jgi:hypothetical protein
MGRKYFPVPYPLGTMTLYIGLALLVWGCSVGMSSLSESIVLRLAVNTALFLAYLFVVFLVERKRGGLQAFSVTGSSWFRSRHP